MFHKVIVFKKTCFFEYNLDTSESEIGIDVSGYTPGLYKVTLASNSNPEHSVSLLIEYGFGHNIPVFSHNSAMSHTDCALNFAKTEIMLSLS